MLGVKITLMLFIYNLALYDQFFITDLIKILNLNVFCIFFVISFVFGNMREIYHTFLLLCYYICCHLSCILRFADIGQLLV